MAAIEGVEREAVEHPEGDVHGGDQQQEPGRVELTAQVDDSDGAEGSPRRIDVIGAPDHGAGEFDHGGRRHQTGHGSHRVTYGATGHPEGTEHVEVLVDRDRITPDPQVAPAGAVAVQLDRGLDSPAIALDGHGHPLTGSEPDVCHQVPPAVHGLSVDGHDPVSGLEAARAGLEGSTRSMRVPR